MLRRLLVVSFAFVLAAGAGMIFLPIAALSDPATREAGSSLAMGALFWAEPDDVAAAFGYVLWAMGIAGCAAPLAIVALIGEIAGARAYTWYAGATALLAAAAPTILRAARGSSRLVEASPAEGRFTLLFFLAGALTGTIYWLIAMRGRDAREREMRSRELRG
ncbi:hypothetical protein MSC49_14030 [Methylosinus sp. C49]|uniref:hypothetical protein n=1 Tax=Methylosinus sp. C49 TaxID=2699395 RepID=UPI00136728B5|nr:hypothetical protein [Methylosinus sp. C49]BBU61468.1 hypothetical protein MSC49_14030 [Methylosinus sp. C49]